MALQVSQWQDVQGVPHYKYGTDHHDLLKIVGGVEGWESGEDTYFSLQMLSPERGWREIQRVTVTQTRYGFFRLRNKRLLSAEAAVEQLKAYAEALYGRRWATSV